MHAVHPDDPLGRNVVEKSPTRLEEGLCVANEGDLSPALGFSRARFRPEADSAATLIASAKRGSFETAGAFGIVRRAWSPPDFAMRSPERMKMS